jgi:hypothetical protein
MKPNTIGVYALSSPVDYYRASRQTPAGTQAEELLEIYVIYTSPGETAKAVQAAAGFADQLGVQIRLVMAYEVSYKLALDRPPVSSKFLEAQLTGIAAKAGVSVDARVCLCRDRKTTLSNLLPPKSLIVMAGRKSWWPSEAQRLASQFQKEGHHVIFAGTK